MRTRQPNDRSPSGGFTLMEVVLVLALLVVLASFIYPALEKPFAAERLRSGADQVRTEWMRARIRAMTTGVPQVFRYQPETGAFRVEIWGKIDAEVEASSAATYNAAMGQQPVVHGTGVQGDRTLPDDVLFAASQTLADSKSLLVAQANSGGQTEQAAWSEPIYFYPDGTTSTARLLLRNDNQLFVLLELRGLTGIVTVSDLLAQEELPQ